MGHNKQLITEPPKLCISKKSSRGQKKDGNIYHEKKERTTNDKKKVDRDANRSQGTRNPYNIPLIYTRSWRSCRAVQEAERIGRLEHRSTATNETQRVLHKKPTIVPNDLVQQSANFRWGSNLGFDLIEKHIVTTRGSNWALTRGGKDYTAHGSLTRRTCTIVTPNGNFQISLTGY